MYCVALDPGGTTGLCIVENTDYPWSLKAMQIGPHEHHKGLLKLLTLWKPDLIICESFENRSHDAAWLVSAEYIGVVKAAVGMCGSKLVLQNASTGKAFWTDEKLRQVGLYIPKWRHARDACRHYLYWRTFKVGDQSLIAQRTQGSIVAISNS